MHQVRRHTLRVRGALCGWCSAFSRHAPSLAVGPAVPAPSKGSTKSPLGEPKPVPGLQSPATPPPRGILRAAKVLGPPTAEESVPMPPIQKSQRPFWWGGTTAELMVILRRALQQRLGSRSDKTSAKPKNKRAQKGIKRISKSKDTFVDTPLSS